MAIKKISELSAATALTGAEIVPIVQGGASVQTTAQDIANLAGTGAVTHEGTITTIMGTAGTSFVVDLPATSVGDLLLINTSVGLSAASVTAPVGWTLLLKASATQHVFWKLSDGAETTVTLTIDSSRKAVATCSRFTGHSASKPFGVPQLKELAGNTTTHTGATTLGKEGSVGVSMVAGLWGGGYTYTINAQWGTPVQVSNTGGSGNGSALATVLFPMEGSDLLPAQNWVCSASLNYSCISVSVLPA